MIQSGALRKFQEFNRSAKYFDAIYADRDFDNWAKLYSNNLGPGVLLEYGCGTGEMLRRFNRADAFGVEPCEEMASVARGKGCKVTAGTMLNSGCRADTACAPWSVLGYAAAQDGLFPCLRAVREALNKPGNVFCFDVTHILGVAKCGLHSGFIQKFPTPDGELTRVTHKDVDWKSGLLRVIFDFHINEISWHEIHVMRCFTVPEIANALHECGFRMASLWPCPSQVRDDSPGHGDLTALVNDCTWEFFVKAVTI